MKFSVATIATLATAAAAQYGAPQQPYGQQPQQYQPQGQYQQPGQYGGYQQPQQYQPAPQQNKYSPAEAHAWHSCIDGFLDQLNVGHEGTKTACSLWTCLENKANQYNRGGALAALGGAVNVVCKGAGIIPGVREPKNIS